jgi:hypothetical protein
MAEADIHNPTRKDTRLEHPDAQRLANAEVSAPNELIPTRPEQGAAPTLRHDSLDGQSAGSEGEADAPKNPNTNHIDMARSIGYALIFGVFAITISQNDFSDLWRLPHPQTSLQMGVFIARLVLFATLAILTFRWIIATNHELFIWLQWLDHPFQRSEVYGAFFALSVFLGIAVAFPHHVIVISALLTAGLLLNYWTQWLANEQFERALRRTQRRSLGPLRIAALPILIAYWIDRPQLGRIATMMFVSGWAYSFAFASAFAPSSVRVPFELAADTILILNIACGECVIAVWRHRRDAALRELLQ